MSEFRKHMDNSNIISSLSTRPPLPNVKLTKQGHMQTDTFFQFCAWRKIVLNNIGNGNLPLGKDPLKEINRQVALAVYSDLEYNFRTTRNALEELTGKSQVYWNFQILGTTAEGGAGKVRTEQFTTDYFIASLLNSLDARGVSLDWKRLGFYLQEARWRVIAEPADKQKRGEFRDECRVQGIEIGIDYPAPWDVSNWAGEHIKSQELQVYLGYPSTMDITLSPGRIKRLDVACFGPDGKRVTVAGEAKFLNRPSILKGLGKRDEKRLEGGGADFEEMLMRTRRKLGQMEQQERERRMTAERRALDLKIELDDLRVEYEKAKGEKKELEELRKENKAMKKWGSEMRKRLEQINKLSWMTDVGRNVNKD